MICILVCALSAVAAVVCAALCFVAAVAGMDADALARLTVLFVLLAFGTLCAAVVEAVDA